MGVDFKKWNDDFRDLFWRGADGRSVRLTSEQRLPTIDVPPPPIIGHADVMRALHDRYAAIESWLVEVLSEHGVPREEIATRCVLVTKGSPRVFDEPWIDFDEPWIDEMHVEIDGTRVAPSLRLTTEFTTEAP